MIGLHLAQALRTIGRPVLGSAVMATIVWAAGRAIPSPPGDPVTLVALVASGVLLYGGAALVLDRPRVAAAVEMLRRRAGAHRAEA